MMNPLNTLQLADSRTAERLAAACRRASGAARRLALHTSAPVEPAEVAVGLAGRRVVRVPRWWSAIDAGTATREVPAVAVGHDTNTEDCVAC